MAQIAKYIGPDLPKLFDETPLLLALRRMADTGGDRLRDFVVAYSPIQSGNLVLSWTRTPANKESYGVGTAYVSKVQTEVDYAPYVNYGTGLFHYPDPHDVIRPKPPNKVLSWIDPLTGQRIFAKSVKGIKPQFIVERATTDLEPVLEEVLAPDVRQWARDQEAMGVEAMRGVLIP